MIGSIGSSYGNTGYEYLYNTKIPSTRPEQPTPTEEKQLKKIGQIECETCSNRTYVDGSDEGNVSFKTPGHISPEASYATVSAHEGEHVANAESEAKKPGVKLVSASVTLQTALCPECGTAYVSGGTTRTQMKYSNEENPYQKDKKGLDAILLRGANIDLVA